MTLMAKVRKMNLDFLTFLMMIMILTIKNDDDENNSKSG